MIVSRAVERRPTALVIGGGIVGLCCAHALARRFDVTLVDAGGASNASTVAAGMLAPGMEAALDPLSPPYPLLSAALALWPAFAAAIGASDALHACGSLWLGSEAPAVSDRLAAVGAEVRRVGPDETRALRPGPAGQAEDGVFTPDDTRVDVAAVLARLAAALTASGVRRVVARMERWEDGRARLADGDTIDADRVVIVAGYAARRLADAAPELASLRPIKGQLIRYALGSAPYDGAMLRTRDGYLAPSGEGVVVGASMEAGRDDLAIDPDVVASFARLGERLCPTLAGASWRPSVGVRAATSDGLPLVGPSSGGALLATGFRRNGWLLAPLAAEMIAAWATDEDPGVWTEALRPGRTLRPGRS